MIRRNIGILVLILFVSSSCKRELFFPEKNQILNYWIFDGLRSVYFWNNTLPGSVNLYAENDPKSFFSALLYDEEDKWSWITDNLPELEAELSGTPFSMGYSPALVKYNDADNIYGVVEFVYPGSPAAVAGLKRGDIISSINEQQLKTSNYQDLLSLDTYSAGLGIFESDAIHSSGISLSMTAKVITADPIIYSEILDIEGIKTGYIVYTDFISGKNEIFLNKLGIILDQFKISGVTDLIIDLRYNRGGDTDAASFLASAIAPVSVVNNRRPFIRFNYNSDLQALIRSTEGANSEKLILRFPENSHNQNLSKVYVLTGSNTASASELLIIGLKPYMQVITIGENTFGKYTGMWIIPDNYAPPRHNYGMILVVNRYSNSIGFTNFRDGLTPDYYVEEDIFNLKPFNDPEDRILSKAKELISGVAVSDETKKVISRKSFIPVFTEKQKMKSNLFLRPLPSSEPLKD